MQGLMARFSNGERSRYYTMTDRYQYYQTAYKKAIGLIKGIYQENISEGDNAIRNMICEEYKRRRLDPDGKAVRYKAGVRCTADGLLSIIRICNLEVSVKDVVAVYEKYREYPIFFFPSENGGINCSRSSILGDRIDHALYDIKMYYSEQREGCLLRDSYSRPKTKQWLENMGSFENIIDWWGVKGIFTDEDYDIYDLEYEESQCIKTHKDSKEYRKQWSLAYYQNLKRKIDMYFERRCNAWD